MYFNQYNNQNSMYPFNNNYTPAHNQQQQQQQFNQKTNTNLINVNSFEDVKKMDIGCNAAFALFDLNEDYFYIKTTDSAGFPSYKKFKFTEVIENSEVQKSDNYVTRQEFNQLKDMLFGNSEKGVIDNG